MEDDNPTPPVDYLVESERLIFASILHSNLLGFIHSKRNIERQEQAALASVAGVKHRIPEVIAFGVKADVRAVVNEGQIEALIEDAGVGEEYVYELQQKLQETVSTRAKLDFYDNMKTLQRVIAETIPTGFGYQDFMDRQGKNKILKRLGLHEESPYYIETVYRTNYTTAHSVGRWKSAQASPLVSMLRFVSVSDDRRTDICKELHGMTLVKNDPGWSVYTPPNHFSCRSTILEVTESYAKINGIKEYMPPVTEIVPTGFDKNPGESDAWMVPSKGMEKRLKEYESAA